MATDHHQAEAVAYFKELQDRLCAALTQADGHAAFREDNWQRHGGGGG
jgi:coproporphyrinogen III oxidase